MRNSPQLDHPLTIRVGVNAKMKQIRKSVVTSLACASVLLPFGSANAETAPAGLNGTWVITKPQAVFQPVTGTVPFTKEGRDRYQANKRSQAARRYDYDNVQTLCATPGLPRLMLTPARFHIWQVGDLITFQFEWNRLFYQVDMGHRPAAPHLVGYNVGVSKGQWQGDTLVVKSSNFTDQTLIDSLVPHSDEMTLTQRIRLVDADTLEDRITIGDPQTFTHSWEAVVTYKRQPDAPFPEDVCADRLRAGQLPLPLK